MNDPPSLPQAQCLESYVDDSKATVHFVQSTRLDIEESPLQETVLRPCHVILSCNLDLTTKSAPVTKTQINN